MIYIVALLLLILVLANEPARGILVGIMVYGGIITAIFAVLIALCVVGYELMNSESFKGISSSLSYMWQNLKQISKDTNHKFIALVALLGLGAFLAYDQYTIRKR